jgi:hypothetical protein
MNAGQIKSKKSARHRIVIVGGGLTGCLIAIALNNIDPDCDFVLIERTGRLGGREISPFFADDIIPKDRALMLDDVMVAQWPRYYMSIGDSCGTRDGSIARVDPLQLHADMLAKIAPSKILLGVEVTGIDGNHIASTLGAFEASTVIDARPHQASDHHTLHLSTFNVVFDTSHPLPYPVLVDEPVQTSTGQICMQYFPLTANEVTVRSLGYGAYDAHPVVVANAAHRDLRIEHIHARIPPSWTDGSLRTPRYASHPLLPSPVPAAVAAARWIAEAACSSPLAPHHSADLTRLMETQFAKFDNPPFGPWSQP